MALHLDVSGLQVQGWGAAGLMRLKPAPRAQAPLVACVGHDGATDTLHPIAQ